MQRRVPPVISNVKTVFQMLKKVQKLAKFSQRARNREGKVGEADRKILQSRPMHLYTGKRGIGKTQRR